jgi:hypothetical protein
MIITAQVDGWTYAACPLGTPEHTFGEFRSAVAMWRAKAAGGLPRKSEFRPEDFRGWLGWVIVYEVEPHPFDLRFRLYGSHLVEKMGFEPTGKRFSEAYAHVPGHTVALDHFRHLRRERMIGISSGPLNWEGLGFRSGVFLDLPVADDSGEVRYFFTFGRFIEAPCPAPAPAPAARWAVTA